VRRLRDPPPVYPEYDVVLPDACARRGAPGADGLHKDGLVAGEGEAVTGRIAEDEHVPENESVSSGLLVLPYVVCMDDEKVTDRTDESEGSGSNRLGVNVKWFFTLTSVLTKFGT
jgi:hypothetical protein